MLSSVDEKTESQDKANVLKFKWWVSGRNETRVGPWLPVKHCFLSYHTFLLGTRASLSVYVGA